MWAFCAFAGSLQRENASMIRLRATSNHSIPQRPPIQLVPGQRVRAGRRDTEWPEFVFVTTGDGAGWVPGRFLDTSSDPAVVLAGYDTTELTTTAGEELTLVERDDPSGRAAACQRCWGRRSGDVAVFAVGEGQREAAQEASGALELPAVATGSATTGASSSSAAVAAIGPQWNHTAPGMRAVPGRRRGGGLKAWWQRLGNHLGGSSWPV
jgi:hypothetical protein